MSETLQGLILVIIFVLVNWGLYVYRSNMSYKKKSHYNLVPPSDFSQNIEEDA